MKSITLLPTYFCVTVKEEAPPKKDTFFTLQELQLYTKGLWGIQELKYMERQKNLAFKYS